MYINATCYYVPEGRVHSDYFLNVNGLTGEWIEQRTGHCYPLESRRGWKYQHDEHESASKRIWQTAVRIGETGLIISASYSPYDTVATADSGASGTAGLSNRRSESFTYLRHVPSVVSLFKCRIKSA
jgi:3-oxoacyl-[acyl-carrier-protein] synthase-3